MPTPSDPNIEERVLSRGRWDPVENRPKRSVFGNFSTTEGDAAERSRRRAQADMALSRRDPAALRHAREVALARAFLYRFLACAYEDPAAESWEWLCNPATSASAAAAWRLLAESVPGAGADSPVPVFQLAGLESFRSACAAVFGHAARGSCPLNEIEYGDLNADPLFQPHRLADLAAFYRAFGLEVTPDAGERLDHISFQLEFMCVLAAKEACALETNEPEDFLVLCRDAQKKFLREHPGRWLPAFARRLGGATKDPLLQALAAFTGTFILGECARFSIQPGADDLLLRPVDEAAESLCASCGLANLPPGALRTT